jgi:succinate dehydrogenase / fumarate reductase cytochrome b subunit
MKNIKNRPISPHLGIYKPQISSVLSISHRITGIINFICLLAFLWWIVSVAYAQTPIDESFVWNFFATGFGKIILIGWSFAMFFHFCTGIRHLFWDAGLGFSLKAVNLTGWIAVGAATLLTILSWLIIFIYGEGV